MRNDLSKNITDIAQKEKIRSLFVSARSNTSPDSLPDWSKHWNHPLVSYADPLPLIRNSCLPWIGPGIDVHSGV